jgi:hypothetical protein
MKKIVRPRNPGRKAPLGFSLFGACTRLIFPVMLGHGNEFPTGRPTNMREDEIPLEEYP